MIKRIVLTDNYGSSNYNSVYSIEKISFCNVGVYLIDELTSEKLTVHESFILSTGPVALPWAGIAQRIFRYYRNLNILLVNLPMQIIAILRKKLNEGAQFHPESLACEYGGKFLITKRNSI